MRLEPAGRFTDDVRLEGGAGWRTFPLKLVSSGYAATKPAKDRTPVAMATAAENTPMTKLLNRECCGAEWLVT